MHLMRFARLAKHGRGGQRSFDRTEFSRRGRNSQRQRTSGVANFLVRVDRVRLLRYGFLIVAGLITARLFLVQIWQHTFYEALASGQHGLVQKLLPKRGEIFVQDKFASTGIAVIATNQTLQHVYANPKQIADHERTAELIAPLLNLSSETVAGRLAKKNDVYEPLRHFVTDQEIQALEQKITAEGLVGIYWVPEEARYYPDGRYTAAITGFVGFASDERQGQYGLEGYFDKQMSGSAGSLSTELDSSGRFIAVGDNSVVEAQDGDSLVLTIDKNIQYKACSVLESAVVAHGAKQGSLILMDPKTGAILAMCNAPTYDPNKYGEVDDIEIFLNDAISDQYEPGSVFKSLAMAAAVDAGLLLPQSTYNDTGVVQIGKYTIQNSDGKAQGVVDMTKVLELSLNTGAIYAVQKVGNERWSEYVRKFGFGERVGISMSGENPGNVYTLSLHKDIYSATSSYGQGITVTPLQLIQAYGALANNGVMMNPYIVERVVKANGFTEVAKPQEAGKPVSAQTAQTIGAMLVRVVDFGHAQRAAVDGYYIAGKTGTAQIPRDDGKGYDPHRHKDTFLGFGPVSDPRFVMLVKIDEPQDVSWAEGSAVPVFGEVARYLVNYLQIPPDRADE